MDFCVSRAPGVSPDFFSPGGGTPESTLAWRPCLSLASMSPVSSTLSQLSLKPSFEPRRSGRVSLGREIPQSPGPLPPPHSLEAAAGTILSGALEPSATGEWPAEFDEAPPTPFSCRTICSGQEGSQSSWRLGSCSISRCAGQELQVGVQGNLQFLLAS